jgi:gas vesicle protein
MADISARPSSAETTTQQIKDQTKAVGESAMQAGGDLVQSAKEQGREVAAETGRQVKQLFGQVRSEVTDQARVQQRRVADGLYSVANEAARIADQGGESGPVTQVVREASGQIMQAGQWLENREPGHVLNELKSYARRHPGAFLVGAAVLGVVAGRLAKNAIGEIPASGSPELPRPRVAVSPVPSTSELQYPDTTYASPTGSASSDGYPTQQARS